MTFSKLIQWIERFGDKISLFHVILISCLLALLSVMNMHGGVLHPEMDVRLPFYMSDTPFLNKIFDSDILDLGTFQARELSYVFDFIDSKFIQFSIQNGFPHFLSLTHYLFSIVTGCLLWLFCVKKLKLSFPIGICWLVLFWTSPSIFLGGVFFRTGKIVVALFIAVLFYMLYNMATMSFKEDGSRISKKVWFLYSVSIFLITFSDGQGLFLALTALIFLAIWSLFIRHKKIYMMLFIGAASILFHGLYRFTIAPWITFFLNGYWPDFSYVQTIPIHIFFQNPSTYLAAGLFFYIETIRFLIGNPPLIVTYILLILFIVLPVIYLYTTLGLSTDDKKHFILALFVLIVIHFLLVIMNVLMILKHKSLMWPDVMRTYYCLPANVIIAMTLAVFTSLFNRSFIPRSLVLILMCGAIAGNVSALPQHQSIMRQGHMKHSYQISSFMLNILDNPNSLDGLDELFMNDSSLLTFFKFKKKKILSEVHFYDEKGTYYAQRGQYRLALKNFSNAILRHPNEIQPYFHRGNLYLKLQHQQPAIEDFNEIIRMKPDFTLAYINRGCAYIDQDNNYMGCHDLQKACELGDCKFFKIVKRDGLCQ